MCDIDPDKAKSAAAEFGVAAWYDDAAAMFDAEAIDLVDIATRMDSHRALAETAIGHGVAMRDAARKAGVFLAVHENFRFQPPMVRVAEILGSGEIGEANWARISFRTGFDVYNTQPYFYSEERFAILDVGIHVLDLARVFLGEAERVYCQAQRRNPKVRAEDTATMVLRHAGGAVSVVEHTYEARRLPDPFPETALTIEGERGAVVLRPGGTIEITSGGELRTEEAVEPLRPWMEERWRVAQQSVPATCRHLLESFRRGVPAATSADDNLKTFALAEAAYESAATGRAIAPPSAP